MTLGLMLLFESRGWGFAEAIERELKLVKEFEPLIDTLWVTEHHSNPLKVNPNPILVLTYLATKTNLNLGTATLLLSFYDPLYISEAISILTNLTDREVFIGVAKGGRSEVKNSHLCLNDKLARERLINNLNSVKKLLHAKRVNLNSKEVTLEPKPKYPPEFFVASLNEEVIKFSAQNSLPLMAGHKWTLAEIKNLKEIYKKYHPNKEEPKLILSRLFYPTDNKTKAIEEIKTKTISNRKEVAKFNKNHEPKEINEKVYEESLIGEPTLYREKLKFFKEFGVSHLILRPAFTELKDSLKGYI